MMSFFEKEFYNDILVEPVPVSVELTTQQECTNPLESDIECDGNYAKQHCAENTCRACLVQGNNFQQLFSPSDARSVSVENNILTMFISCTSLQVTSNDQYPKQICANCIEELSKAYEFWKKCRRSVETLNKIRSPKKNDEFLRKYNVKVNNIKVEHNTDRDILSKQKYIEQLKLQLKELDELELKRQHLEQSKNTKVSELIDDSKTVDRFSNNEEQSYSDIGSPCALSDNESTSSSTPIAQLVTKMKQKVKQSPPAKENRVTKLKKNKTHKSQQNQDQKPKRTHTVTVKKASNLRIKFTEGGTKYRLSVKQSKSRSNFLCPECGRVVVGSTGFQAHMASHSEVRPYTCDQCDKKYKSYSALKVHIRNHTGERKYHCKQCDAKFITWNSLSSHIKTHHSDARPFVCDICSTAFKYSGSLIVHKRQHTGEKPYACTECTWAFASPGSLRAHMTKHTGERKYPCPLCEKRFRKPYAVKVHMVTHTGERKHKCELCGKAFTQAHVLRSHMKTHQDHQIPVAHPT